MEEINEKLHNASPEEIVKISLSHARNPVITTSFGSYSAAILHLVCSIHPDIPVIWCDTGYNTTHTYRYVEAIKKRLDLNLHIYVPELTSAYWESVYGGIPGIDDPRHKDFTRKVKLEPFERAMRDFEPDVWFTNIRKGQTKFRDALGVASYNQSGVLKISPFYQYTDRELDTYLQEFDLFNEPRYYDPTKVFEHRECGIHLI